MEGTGALRQVVIASVEANAKSAIELRSSGCNYTLENLEGLISRSNKMNVCDRDRYRVTLLNFSTGIRDNNKFTL